MKVKVISATGPRPPEIGIWWTDTYNGEKAAQEVAAGLRQHEWGSLINWDLSHADYANDLYRWIEVKKWTVEKWWAEVWDNESYSEGTIWWGVVLDREPEMNEFGEVCP